MYSNDVWLTSCRTCNIRIKQNCLARSTDIIGLVLTMLVSLYARTGLTIKFLYYTILEIPSKVRSEGIGRQNKNHIVITTF